MFLFFDDRQILFVLLWALSVGAGLGAVYDLFRIARIARRPTKASSKSCRAWVKFASYLLVFFEDVVYCVFAAIVTILFVFMTSKGQLRPFALLCEAAGFAVYHFTVGRVAVWAAVRIVLLCRRTAHFCYARVIAPPAKALARFAVKTTVIIWRHTAIAARHSYRAAREKRRRRAFAVYSDRRMKELLAEAARGFESSS